MLLSLPPTRGTIHIFGRDATTLTKDDLTALRRRIGVVFQDFRLLDHLTTYENVALPLRALGPGRIRATGPKWWSFCAGSGSASG